FAPFRPLICEGTAAEIPRRSRTAGTNPYAACPPLRRYWGTELINHDIRRIVLRTGISCLFGKGTGTKILRF
ncbi:hypothetical protein KJ608_03450, partial [Patescibacteria group bacterium]|nr:hypothetical protein [Patescibacteria group bacterium]